MKKKQYFKLETNLMKSDSTQRLIKDLRMEGMGVFMTLIFHLRKQKRYRCNVSELYQIAVNAGMNPEVAKKVVYNYGLFRFDDFHGQVFFSSHHLNESMVESFGRSEAAKKTVKTKQRGENGQFVVNDQVPNITNDTKTQQEAASEMLWKQKLSEPWSKYIDQIIIDPIWVESIAMNNNLPIMSKLEKITEIFKRHVVIQGKEYQINSIQEAKNYFANYVRRGTPSHRDLMNQLREKDKATKAENPYRFEEINPKTGERSYCGIPIPPSAPPRPSDNAVWNALTGQWEL